ncbi:MAG TPA: hypothetical protein VMT46_06845 [Anaerolineaceae bacterium]|nr:hypothetical protein [Anaerolineaceae bacterium]
MSVRRRRRRPFGITLLALGFLGVGILGWLRFGQALAQWNLLVELDAWPGPLYLAVGGAVWGSLGILVALALAAGSRSGPLLAQGAVLFFLLTYWVDRLISVWIGNPFANWPILLVLSLAAAGLTFWLVTRPANRDFFLGHP